MCIYIHIIITDYGLRCRLRLALDWPHKTECRITACNTSRFNLELLRHWSRAWARRLVWWTRPAAPASWRCARRSVSLARRSSTRMRGRAICNWSSRRPPQASRTGRHRLRRMPAGAAARAPFHTCGNLVAPRRCRDGIGEYGQWHGPHYGALETQRTFTLIVRRC